MPTSELTWPLMVPLDPTWPNLIPLGPLNPARPPFDLVEQKSIACRRKERFTQSFLKLLVAAKNAKKTGQLENKCAAQNSRTYWEFILKTLRGNPLYVADMDCKWTEKCCMQTQTLCHKVARTSFGCSYMSYAGRGWEKIMQESCSFNSWTNNGHFTS